MKISKYLFLLIISFFSFITISHANYIRKIDMEVYLDKYGDAHIHEVWNAYLDKGTEGYRPFSGLGPSKITDFKVTDSTGTEYTFKDNWNVNDGFLQKKYQNGINYTNSGLELCWGISNYGDNIYNLDYTITNFVKDYLDDVQGIYFNFINLDQEVGKATITFKSDFDLNLDSARIWAFGNNGKIEFKDNTIYYDSVKVLNQNDYMVALIRFENKYFETGPENRVNKTFDEVHDEAFVGVKVESKTSKIKKTIFLVLKILAIPVIVLTLIIFIYGIKRRKYISGLSLLVTLLIITPCMLFMYFYAKELLVATVPVMIAVVISFIPSMLVNLSANSANKKRKEITSSQGINTNYDYYRDIPCNNDLLIIYWVCLKYKLIDIYTLRKGLISAYFMKWIMKEDIKVNRPSEGGFNLFKSNEYSFDLTTSASKVFDDDTQEELMSYILEASRGNYILESKEFYKWSKENYIKYDVWYIHVLAEAEKRLKEKGILDSTVVEYTNQIPAFINFMLDFSNVAEKDFFEVHIFEDYLVVASLLGIADKVEEQFKKLYPDYMVRYDFAPILSFTDNWYNAYDEARRITERSRVDDMASFSHDYSGTTTYSGGGGKSYHGGGKSSGGSSGGGFR